MFCYNCGNQVDDNAVVCVHCGCQLKEIKSNSSHNESKSGIGVLMALFLGVVGLIVGICIFPKRTIARKTFFYGWIVTFLITLAIKIFFIGISLFVLI